MVGVAGLEPAASWSRTMHATICATPRDSFYIIARPLSIVKHFFWMIGIESYKKICILS